MENLRKRRLIETDWYQDLYKRGDLLDYNYDEEEEKKIEKYGKNEKKIKESKNLDINIFEGIIDKSILEKESTKSYERVEGTFNRIKNLAFKDKSHFAFVKGNKSTQYNKIIIQEIEKLFKIYQNEGDFGRQLAYRKAISVLKNLGKEIESEEDLENLPRIGPKIKEKISEILSTGKLKKAEAFENDIRNKTIELFKGVWGVGPQKAIELYMQGLRTIEDLRLKSNLKKLNRNQKIGLRYYEDLIQKIDRDEVEKVVKLVKKKILEIEPENEKGIHESICCGSYRRGRSKCGDIDILISRKDHKNYGIFLIKLLEALEEDNLLQERLQVTKISSSGSMSYMGICKTDTLHRRIDMKIYPRKNFGFAVLYFTGSDHFNRSMRLFAKKNGFSLSDHGLTRTNRVNGQKVWKGDEVTCENEKEVFKLLGMEFKEPNERDI